MVSPWIQFYTPWKKTGRFRLTPGIIWPRVEIEECRKNGTTDGITERYGKEEFRFRRIRNYEIAKAKRVAEECAKLS